MDVKDLEELKSFVEWARSQKITRIKLGDVEIDIFPMSYVDGATSDFQAPVPEAPAVELTAEEEAIVNAKPVPPGASSSWVESMERFAADEDPDLFYSAK